MSHETPVYLGALDVGTSSIRCMVFNKQDLSVVCTSTLPIQTNHPYPGWVEQDPIEYVVVSSRCIADALGQLKAITNNANATLSCLGIANQRETTIAWDRQAMKPFANAIVWSDNRTQSIVQSYKKKYATEIQMDDGSEYFLARSGLPISTYFSSYKMRWLIENVPELREALEDPMQRGRATLTTVDSWLLFMLTAGECFVTDITNASRTNLMNLTSGAWDTELCDAFGIPIEILPRIVSNQCGVLGRLQESKYVTSSLIGIPITTLMGDQQAALFGHMCVRLGSTKCTYGTGCFLLRNIGSSPPDEKLLRSTGTVGTIAYKLKSEDHPVYALEGSIGVAGTVLSWIQKNWCHVSSPEEVTSLAASVPDTGDVYFVPAFSGLYSPLWDSDARGTIVGITEHTTTAHIVRSGLQAICFQVCDVINAMNRNSRGHDESKLRDAPASNFEVLEEYLSVDGGVTNNNFLMQMQADFLQLPIQVPHVNEATSLGAAMMAGLSLGLWSGEIDSVQKQYNLYYKSRVFNPVSTSLDSHAHEYERWKDAVGRSRGWAKTSYGKP